MTYVFRLVIHTKGDDLKNRQLKEGVPLRNKAKDFPYKNENKFEGEPRAKAEYSPMRANGTINTDPQGRMRASGNRESNSNQS